MEISNIGENSADGHPYTASGRANWFMFLNMYLEIHTKNFKMVLNFSWSNNASGNLSLGNNYRCTQKSIHQDILCSTMYNITTTKRKVSTCSIE